LFVPEQPNGSSSVPGVLLATSAFGPAVLLASFCAVHSIASASLFSGARPKHLHGPAVSHSLFRFVHHSFTRCSWGGRCFYTGSSRTGRFPFFVLEVADPSTMSTCFRPVAGARSLDSWFPSCLPGVLVVRSEGPSFQGSSYHIVPGTNFPNAVFHLPCHFCTAGRVRPQDVSRGSCHCCATGHPYVASLPLLMCHFCKVA
jgi:hypothetical protein